MNKNDNSDTKMRHLFTFTILAICFIVLSSSRELNAAGGGKTVKPNLTNIVKGKGWRVVNRKTTLFNEGGKKGVRFDEKPDVGIAWLDDYEFKDGSIEFDVKGKNVLQKSFVGVAFHGKDDRIYDVVYFRPFNFMSSDPERRSHAVQYIAPPDHDWKALRQEFPGKYEHSVEPAPNPDDWFHARILVAGKTVSVFVNAGEKPSLVVEKLTESRSGKIGLWVGDQSDGMFANLKITGAHRK